VQIRDLAYARQIDYGARCAIRWDEPE